MSSPTPDSEPYIPRPPNAFLLYRIDRNREMKAKKERTGTQSQVSKTIGLQWKQESPEVKLAYKKLAKSVKERHKELYPHYRYKPGKKKSTPIAHLTKQEPLHEQLGVPPLDGYAPMLFPQNGGSRPSFPGFTQSPASSSAYTSPEPSPPTPGLSPQEGVSFVESKLEQNIPDGVPMEDHRNVHIALQLLDSYAMHRASGQQAWDALRAHLLQSTAQFPAGTPNNRAHVLQTEMLMKMMQNPQLITMHSMNGPQRLSRHPIAAPKYGPAHMQRQMGDPRPAQAAQPWPWNAEHAPLNVGFFDFANAQAGARVRPQSPPYPLDVQSFDLTQSPGGSSQSHAQLPPPSATPQDHGRPMMRAYPRWDMDTEEPVDMSSLGLLPVGGVHDRFDADASPSVTTGASILSRSGPRVASGEESSGGMGPFLSDSSPSDLSSSGSATVGHPSSGDPANGELISSHSAPSCSDSQHHMRLYSAVDGSSVAQDSENPLKTLPADAVWPDSLPFESPEAQAWFNFPDA